MHDDDIYIIISFFFSLISLSEKERKNTKTQRDGEMMDDDNETQ